MTKIKSETNNELAKIAAMQEKLTDIASLHKKLIRLEDKLEAAKSNNGKDSIRSVYREELYDEMTLSDFMSMLEAASKGTDVNKATCVVSDGEFIVYEPIVINLTDEIARYNTEIEEIKSKITELKSELNI